MGMGRFGYGYGRVGPWMYGWYRNRVEVPQVQPGSVANLAGPGPEPVAPEFSVYIACGTDTSKGIVYQTDETGRVVANVALPYTATGMALHRNHGLVVAIPRDGGKIMEIDDNGRVSTILERDRSLLHPVRVAVPGNSDVVLVADDISQVVAATNTQGVKPTIYQHFNWQKSNPGMAVAMTLDKHVIFGTDGAPGVYRYEDGASASARKPLLKSYGGVAADPRSLRWAAAQPDQILRVRRQRVAQEAPPAAEQDAVSQRPGFVLAQGGGVRGRAGQRKAQRPGHPPDVQHREGSRPEHLFLEQGRDDGLRSRPADALERNPAEQPEKHPLILTDGPDFRGAAGIAPQVAAAPRKWDGPASGRPFWKNLPDSPPAT